jgi:hypothetical protein
VPAFLHPAKVTDSRQERSPLIITVYLRWAIRKTWEYYPIVGEMYTFRDIVNYLCDLCIFLLIHRSMSIVYYICQFVNTQWIKYN